MMMMAMKMITVEMENYDYGARGMVLKLQSKSSLNLVIMITVI